MNRLIRIRGLKGCLRLHGLTGGMPMMQPQYAAADEGRCTGSNIYWDHGENAARPWVGIDLRDARTRTATGNLTNAQDVQHMNEGRHDGMPRELAPMPIMLAESP